MAKSGSTPRASSRRRASTSHSLAALCIACIIFADAGRTTRADTAAKTRFDPTSLSHSAGGVQQAKKEKHT